MNGRVWVLALVLTIHGALLAAGWFARVEIPRKEAAEPMFVAMRDPQSRPDKDLPAPAPARPVAPVPVTIAYDPPSIQIPRFDESPAPRAADRSEQIQPNGSASKALSTELAVQCPDRTPPRYPALAKRQREQGEVRLRVELDETGRIDRVTIVSSSGSPRLDDAARAAIESWRCLPARQDGQPVRAVALQSLAFVLERK